MNLVRIEEGRRYLNYNSKIANDIKRMRRKNKQLDSLTNEYLNDILNLLNPPLERNINVTYYFKAEEGNMPLQTQRSKVQNNKGNKINEKDSKIPTTRKGTVGVIYKNPKKITYLIGHRVSYAYYVMYVLLNKEEVLN